MWRSEILITTLNKIAYGSGTRDISQPGTESDTCSMPYTQDMNNNTCVFASGLQVIAKSNTLLEMLSSASPDLKTSIRNGDKAEDVMAHEDFQRILCDTNYYGDNLRVKDGLPDLDIDPPARSYNIPGFMEKNIADAKKYGQMAYAFFKSVFVEETNCVAVKSSNHEKMFDDLKEGLNILFIRIDDDKESFPRIVELLNRTGFEGMVASYNFIGNGFFRIETKPGKYKRGKEDTRKFAHAIPVIRGDDGNFCAGNPYNNPFKKIGIFEYDGFPASEGFTGNPDDYGFVTTSLENIHVVHLTVLMKI